MRRYHSVPIALALLIAGVPDVSARTDMSLVTCRAFLASGQANMAAIIMWLRGYHAGKRGVIDVIDKPPMDPYGGRLGHDCKEHPDESVINASERILSELDHGI